MRNELQKYLYFLCVTWACLVWGVAPSYANQCAAPQVVTTTLSGIVNGYWGGVGSVSAGATSITLGNAVTSPRQGTGTLQAGDLVVVMQMQAAEINTADSANYGANDGTGRGQLNNANFTAGQWEYAEVLSASGSSITLAQPLANSYSTATPSGSVGMRTFQVIRVPTAVNATLTGAITASAWDGVSGGVVVLDASNTLNLNGQTISVDALGFLGGGARNTAGATNTQYRSPANGAAADLGGSKGEGIAGRPRYVRGTNTSPTDWGQANEYPQGSLLRGAPGNAGGGGDAHNCGGGGGGNGGPGGSASSSCWAGGGAGVGGAAFAVASASRLAMGGGGGAGDANNTGVLYPHGGNGGGVIIVRAASTAGTGILSADGQNGNVPNPTNDGGGGGGAGGSILYNVASGSVAGVTFRARGGNGANSGGGHGQAGGGGGGVVLRGSSLTGAPTIQTTGGIGGSNGSATAGDGGVYGGTTSMTPATCAAFNISGTIYQDVLGAAAAWGAANTTALGSGNTSGVTVRLFNTAGVQLATTNTDAAGLYTFTGFSAGTYYVAVDPPTQVSGVSQVLEQTTATTGNADTGSGPICVSSSYVDKANAANVTALSAWVTGAQGGAGSITCFGGRQGAVANNAGATSLIAQDKEHVARVFLSDTRTAANHVTGVNFGFSANVVTHLSDTLTQGSLRQFITNANAIVGANAMRFVPAVATNQTSGTNTWWRISPTTALPAISGPNAGNTTLDGRAYNLADGITQLQTNTASIGSAISVGTGLDGRMATGDEFAMTALNGPELEIARTSTVTGDFTLQTQAANTLIQNLCINNPSALTGVAMVLVSSTANNSSVLNNLLGSGCASSTLDGSGSPTNASGSGIIAFENSTGVTISGNKIGNRALGIAQLTTVGAANNVTISGNEVYNDTGAGSSINLGVGNNNLGLAGTSIIRDNYLWGIAGRSFEDDANSTYTFINNTALRGARVGTSAIATSQLRLFQNNVFHNNTDTGAQGQGLVIGPIGSAATTRVQVTQNSFFNNQNNAIDIGGGGVNLPSSSCAGGGANGNSSLARPTITNAGLSGTILTLSGTYCNNGDTFTLEFYKASGSCATGDCDGSGTPQVAGEGQTYLGSLTGLSGGTFTNQTLSIPSGVLTGTDSISAIVIRTVSATNPLGDTSEFSANVGLFGLSGVVYEDVNYGGGAGRDLVSSSGVGRNGARVELYRETTAGSGVYAFVASTTTATLAGQAGSYQFGALSVANYRVRVVNNASNRISSSRSGDTNTIYGVQTYRVDGSTGTAVAVTNEVGGRTPAFTSDAANVTTLGAAFPNGGTSGSQAMYWAPVTLSATFPNVANVNFGFNFDTIVNVADCTNPSASVQCLGSLRQFITNANALSNTGLAQALPVAIAADYIAGDEVSIFMVPTAALTSGVAKISLTSLLPQITGTNATATKIDGRTQTYNTTTSTGDTNSGMLGVGGVVGVDALMLSQVNRPEVEITALTPNLETGLDTNAANIAIRGVAMWGFNNFVLVYNANNFIAQQNLLGSSASSFTQPAILPTSAGIYFPNAATGSNVLIENNLIGFTGQNGLYVGQGAVTNWTIRNNEFRRNGISPTAQSGLGEGIFIENLGNLNMLIEGNLLIQNDQQGVELDYGSGLTIRNNSFIANGPRAQEQAQIFFYQVSNSTIQKNIIRDGIQDGILLTNNSATVTVSQNSIYNNTGLGINLVVDYLEPNTGFVPTLNDANDVDTGANGFLNFPIIQSAILAGSNLIVSGCAPAGATIELFEADVSPGGAASTGANTFAPRTLDYGEGQIYLSTFIEGGGSDTDTGSCSSPVDDIDGNVQAGMNKFSFSIAIPVGVVSGDLLTATSTLAAATSEFSPVAEVRSNDYGDAPLSYGQVSHAAVGPILGALRDIDASYPASPGLLADADDTTGIDDEDALSNLPLVHAGMIGVANGYSLTFPVSNITANTNVCAWLDFNRDGSFAASEGSCAVLTTGATTTTLNFTVPNTLMVGDLYARLRITTTALTTADGGNTSAFINGEVEDYYRANGIKPVIRINKVLTPAGVGDLLKLEVVGGNATPTSGANNPAINIGNGGTTGWIIADQASSLSVSEHQWLSRPLTAFTTTLACTEGDGITPHLVSSPNLTGAVTRSASITAPATSAVGMAAQRICTFTNAEPTAYSISGKVFADIGLGAGIANDALQNGAEAGIAGVTVKLTNCSGTVYATTTTQPTGDYSFDASLASVGTVCIEQSNLASYLSTGANKAGTVLPDGVATSVSGTNYTYTRSTDRIQFTLVAATDYLNLNFADIPSSTLQANGANTVPAGTTTTYAHTFVAGSAGSVTFSASNTASPANVGWAHSLFADNDCNGVLDLTAGDTALTLTQSVTAGQSICVIVRQNTPAGANQGDSNTVTLTANMSYTGASPALVQTLILQDITTITNSSLVLNKQVRNVTQGGAWGQSNQAKSGDVLEYKIVYTNIGNQALNTLQVNDATPAFTTFVSASCIMPLPASLTTCSVSSQPAVGASGSIVWSFTGSLAPNGVSGEVTYQVTVE